ncbi:MAG: twin-arginine translocase subunit TatC [Rikenellaceae bacterium]|nr:twin-arginine translocase subunit TatC [Rikenellaceae bacterium]
MPRKSTSPKAEMTFFEHLDALRPHLFRGAVAFLIFFIAAFALKGFVIDMVLMGPSKPDFPTNKLLGWLAGLSGVDGLQPNAQQIKMINTTLGGQFNLHMRISFVTGLVLAIPYMLWEIWQFVKPALTARERRGTNMLVSYVSLCFFTGLMFGYFLIAPLSVNFLANYVASSDIDNMIDVNSYLSTVLNVSMATAAVFQLPLLVYFLTRIGLLTPAFMRKYRRHSIVVLTIFAAVITPPDIVSCLLVLAPLYGLYELGIYISARTRRRMERRREQEEAEFNAYPVVATGSGSESD